MAESAGLLFKIKGDETDAVRALKNTEQQTDKLTGATTGLASGMTSLINPATIAAATIVAVSTAAIAGTRALFDMSKSAAEFGSQIFDASEKTGLSAEALSAMKFAADQSGTSLEAVTAASAKFAKTIGDAGNGSKEAEAKLKRLGVTSRDLDTALGQALSTIAKMKPGTEQMTAAMDAFGRSGADLLPFIKSFDGDLVALIAKAKELGVTIDGETARAADEFGDQLDTLNAQINALTRSIGFAFMPVFNDLARGLSDFLKDNQTEIKSWGNNLSLTLQGLILQFKELKKVADDYHASSAISAAGRLNPFYQAGQLLGRDARDRARQASTDVLDAQGGSNYYLDPATNTMQPRTPTNAPASTTGPAEPEKVKTSNIDRADSQAQVNAVLRAREIRDITAEIATENINLRVTQEAMAAAYEVIRAKLGEGSSIVGFTKATNEVTKQWADNLQNSISFIEQLEIKALRKDATQAERDLLTAQQQDRRHKLKLTQDEQIKKNQDALFQQQKEQWEAEAKKDADKAIADQAAWELQQERTGAGTVDFSGPLSGLTNPLADEEASPFYLWQQGWEDFFSTVEQDAPVLGSLFEDLGGIMQGAFEGLARSIGSVVQQWVIYGNTGPAVMRKMLAAVLASVAAEAAVKAIMATAEGFYFLATHQYDSAANAFIAAGFYGSVAAVAAVTGRAIAGNSFNQQSNRATGGSSSSSSSRGGNQGEAYSQYGDEVQVRESGRNQPSGSMVQIGLKDGASRILADLLEIELKNNGPFRDSIRRTAEG